MMEDDDAQEGEYQIDSLQVQTKINEGPTRARGGRTVPRRLRQQYRAWKLVVENGWRQEDVRVELGLQTCQTVARMVADEEEAHAVEFYHVRKVEIAQSCAAYDQIARVYTERMNGPNARGDEAKFILRARWQKEHLLGLHVERAEIELKAPNPLDQTVKTHMDRIKGLPEPERSAAIGGVLMAAVAARGYPA